MCLKAVVAVVPVDEGDNVLGTREVNEKLIEFDRAQQGTIWGRTAGSCVWILGQSGCACGLGKSVPKLPRLCPPTYPSVVNRALIPSISCLSWRLFFNSVDILLCACIAVV